MVKAGLFACWLVLASACGGKAGKTTDDAPGAAGASGTSGKHTGREPGVAGSAGTAEVLCAETPRSVEDDVANMAVVDMAAHAEPNKLVPLMISLVEVPVFPGVNEADRAVELEPYQAPVAAKLEEWGAEGIERFWLVNAIAASVPAKYVAQVLCLPNVRVLSVDAPYWDIVEPPWGADEAGTLECPLAGDRCPEHCFDLYAAPWNAAAGCYDYDARERVACTTSQGLIDDGGSSCVENVTSGETYALYGFVPREPYFLGWRPCSPEREVKICGQ
jgi:hypothetical protein